MLNILDSKQYEIPDDLDESKSLADQTLRLNLDTVVLKLSLEDVALLVEAMYGALSRLGAEGNQAQQMLRIRRKHLASQCNPPCLFSVN